MRDVAGADDHAPRRVTAFAVLAALGPVLIVAAVLGLIYAQYQFSVRNNGYSGTDAPTFIVVAQVLYAVAPAVLTGGIVCVGLALAVAAQRSDRLVSPSPVEEDLRLDRLRDPRTPVDVAPERSSVDTRASVERVVDPETYKRPRADKHPAS